MKKIGNTLLYALVIAFSIPHTNIASDETKKFGGAILMPPDTSQIKLLSLPIIEDLPAKFDWRDNNGNWLTPVKDQGGCNSCWAFSAIAQVETWWKITNNNPDLMIDLSEQFLLSCSSVNCEPGLVGDALDFLKLTGIPTETCLEYQGNAEISCSDACENWENEAVKIPEWGYITISEAITETIKNAIYHHPVSATLSVYEDLSDGYVGGVYEHTYGTDNFGHAILIVGWNDEEQSWICKNSWGTGWGDQGYFRIKWGECGIGLNVSFIGNVSPVTNLSPKKFDLSLTCGDTIVEKISISNSGLSQLKYSVNDYLRNDKFHISTEVAWDDYSWWCGDPQLDGYANNWLQYLETPLLDLSNTAAPRLSFMGLWRVQKPDKVFDHIGFDGCNVWISIDGGQTYHIADPSNPKYNCTHINGFGRQGTTEDIPGWAGSSIYWLPVEFDLSSFKSDSVVIRFAFASNKTICTLDDPLIYGFLYGFLVDEILVSDGPSILFEDHGNEETAMRPIGFEQRKAEGFDFFTESTIVEPNESTSVDIRIKTGLLEPGSYQNMLRITSNDKFNPIFEIPINLEVRKADYDIAITKIGLPNHDIPLFALIEPSVKIENRGNYDATGFDLVYKVLFNGKPHYDETLHIPSILAGHADTISYQPFSSAKTGDFEFITALNYDNDYNFDNNYIHESLSVTEWIDDFESGSGMWEFEGGWGLSDKDSRGIGTHVASVIRNSPQYLNNMNTTMTYKSKFNARSACVKIRYWARYETEQDKDICYLELSGDSLNWIKIDSLSGGDFGSWERQPLPLNPIPDIGSDQFWLRFHFISDNQNMMRGVYIDDIQIFAKEDAECIVHINPEPLINSVPKTYNLAQNYPNPFNPSTIIKFALPKPERVNIDVYNIMGQKIETVLNEPMRAGYHEIEFNAQNLSSGVYFYRIEAGEFQQVKKMILLK
jgi:C1A family cysteine protease